VLKDDDRSGCWGNGVQGPAQALNLRDNRLRVIVGQKSAQQILGKGAQRWLGAWRTLSRGGAAERGTGVQYLIFDAGRSLMWAQIKHT